MVELRYPPGIKRQVGYWLSPSAGWASRRKFFRRDNSNQWRKAYFGPSLSRYPNRSVPLTDVLGRGTSGRLRLLIVGDTGEGDRSQYSTLPLIRALAPDMMIINGDAVYPAGRLEDFKRGFFAPYKGLGIPIWAVPGNHEYYSKDKGRTFFQVFCTNWLAREWSAAGLLQVPQPGTYWELTCEEPGLSIIGLDTGIKGDLDGEGRGHDRDAEQYGWLQQRLRLAEERGWKVVVLFHIPALVDERHAKKVHLAELHRMLAASPAVALVLSAHIHNYQYYTPDVFRSYLLEQHRSRPVQQGGFPHYVVAGGGGAYLAKPVRSGRYKADVFFPDLDQWKDFASWAEKIVGNAGLGKWAISRLASAFSSSQRADADAGKYLSLTMLDVDATTNGAGVEVRHVLMDDLENLFSLPDGTPVWVDDPRPPVDPARLAGLVQAHPPLHL